MFSYVLLKKLLLWSKIVYLKTYTIFFRVVVDCEFFFSFFISIVADTFKSDVAMLFYI